MEELIISIIDRATKAHIHHAGAEEKGEKNTIRLRI